MKTQRCKDCRRTDFPVFFDHQYKMFLCESCSFSRTMDSAHFEDADRDESYAVFNTMTVQEYDRAECGHIVRIGGVGCDACCEVA